MSKQRRPFKPEVKICLPAQIHTLSLTADEYELLGDFLEFLWEQDTVDLIEFANEYRKQLYGDDWTPDIDWTPEKFDKVFESFTEKHAKAGFFGRRDMN